MNVPTPTPYTTPIPPPPTGNRLARGIRQLLKGHVPYVLEGPLDQFCTRLGLRTKIVDIDGLKIRIRRKPAEDYTFLYNIIELQEYNPPGYELRPTDTVIDIGGNLGTFTLYAAKRARRVFTFEPMTENIELLRDNVARNQLTNIHPFQMAVVGTLPPGRKVMIQKAVSHKTGSHSVMLHDFYGDSEPELGSVSIDGTTLPEIFENNAIDRCHLLKLDCEGAEFGILEQLPAAYYARIDRMVMEYHSLSLDLREKRAMVDPLVARLQEHGFTIDSYQHNVGFRSGFIHAARR